MKSIKLIYLSVVLALLYTLSALTGNAFATELNATTEPSRAVTLTYLKSAPGQLRDLERYVRANWFAMDKIAVENGLFASYVWLDTGTDEGPWNAIVKVTYLDSRGFAGIQERWGPIKAAHEEVRINGKGQDQLGKIVDSQTVYERAPFLTLVPPPSASAQGETDEVSSDELGIRATISRYFLAQETNDPSFIRDAFLPTATIEGVVGAALVTWSRDEYLRFFKSTPGPNAKTTVRRIEDVSVRGDSASVKLELNFASGETLLETFLLFKTNGEWRIAHKA